MVAQGNGARGLLAALLWVGFTPALAIDVKLSSEEAQKALEAGRTPMEKANSPEEVKKVLQHASMATRVGADPEKDACGASASSKYDDSSMYRVRRDRLLIVTRRSSASLAVTVISSFVSTS